MSEKERSRAFWNEWYPPTRAELEKVDRGSITVTGVFPVALDADQIRERYAIDSVKLPGTCAECGWEGDVGVCERDEHDFPRCGGCGGVCLTWDGPADEPVVR